MAGCNLKPLAQLTGRGVVGVELAEREGNEGRVPSRLPATIASLNRAVDLTQTPDETPVLVRLGHDAVDLLPEIIHPVEVVQHGRRNRVGEVMRPLL